MKRTFVLFLSLVAGSLLLVAGAGCGQRVSHLPVEGKVLFRNQPLKTGLVIFHPDRSKENNSTLAARGAIKNGVYQLKSDDGKAGTAAGWYKVAVVANEVPADPKKEEDKYAVPKSLIPTGYNDPEKSGLRVHVEANPKDGAYTIKLSK